jgi:HPt (histidine-containing phosphotransfer) domain-containing protein
MTKANRTDKLHNFSYFESIGMDEEEFMDKIIIAFLRDLPQSLLDIKLALERNEWKNLGSYAHKLKSSFMMLGLDAKLCLELELLGKTENPDKERMITLSKEVCEILGKVILELKLYPQK